MRTSYSEYWKKKRKRKYNPQSTLDQEKEMFPKTGTTVSRKRPKIGSTKLQQKTPSLDTFSQKYQSRETTIKPLTTPKPVKPPMMAKPQTQIRKTPAIQTAPVTERTSSLVRHDTTAPRRRDTMDLSPKRTLSSNAVEARSAERRDTWTRFPTHKNDPAANRRLRDQEMERELKRLRDAISQSAKPEERTAEDHEEIFAKDFPD